MRRESFYSPFLAGNFVLIFIFCHKSFVSLEIIMFSIEGFHPIGEIGYLFTCVLEIMPCYFVTMDAICALSFLIGFCIMLIALANDIKTELFTLNDLIPTAAN